MGIGGLGGPAAGAGAEIGPEADGEVPGEATLPLFAAPGFSLAQAADVAADASRFLGELGVSTADLLRRGALEGTIRSFFPPRPQFPIAAPPAIGSPAPLLPPDVPGPAVLKLFRHPGCPFAAEDKENLLRAARENPNMTYVAVVEGDPAIAKAWLADPGGLPNVKVVTDPACEYWSKWGVAPTSTSYFAGPEGLLATGRQMAKGYPLDTLTGNRHWPAMTAAIGADGKVAGYWPERKMGQWVDIGTATAAAGGAAGA
jgi:hypothetical protein